MKPDSPPKCPIHGRKLECPACAGKMGGAARTPAKMAAAMKNLERINNARKRKKEAKDD